MKLSEICYVLSGGTPKTSNKDYWNGNIPWISINDFIAVNRFVDSTEKAITESGFKNCSSHMLNNNDIIISARGTMGKTALVRTPMAFNQSCYGLRSKLPQKLNQEYLFYWLRANKRIFTACNQGAVFNNITRTFFDSCELSFSDIDSQLRITNT